MKQLENRTSIGRPVALDLLHNHRLVPRSRTLSKAQLRLGDIQGLAEKLDYGLVRLAVFRLGRDAQLNNVIGDDLDALPVFASPRFDVQPQLQDTLRCLLGTGQEADGCTSWRCHGDAVEKLQFRCKRDHMHPKQSAAQYPDSAAFIKQSKAEAPTQSPPTR
ncbi:hypothetical protein TARUN_1457 [Trichoderma arundinaceum]|uniref:Uncharacterized protein n=1 Tax=Trichoderma arundinaceum TaxID=490622 RepID=A0A395NXF9_TRIAR|nr:hypothetical protein TARUN_1457 [Trichoderma arundinaceum]